MDAITIRKNGKAEMAYVGQKPWHGLGEELPPGESIERWLIAAGMDWKVQRSKVRYVVEPCVDLFKPGIIKEWSDRHVLFRSDSKSPLGLVSDGFKIVQPREVMEFFRDLTAKNGFQLETAGTLFGGKRYWAMAKTQHELTIGGRDRLGCYLLLATACDGSMHTTGKFVAERVVCHNTLSIALGEKKPAVKVRHSTEFKETEMKIELGVVDDAWNIFSDNAHKLAAHKVSKSEALDILINVLGDPAKLVIDTTNVGREKALEAQPNMRGMATIMKMFDGAARGAELASAKDTAWGLVNAATEYFDHVAGREQSNRLASSWFGVNDQHKTAIMKEALKVADK